MSTSLSGIGRVSVKPSEFSDASAAGWFAIIEAQFVLANITVDSTKFYTALAALPSLTVQRLSAEILEEKSYNKLKESVLLLVERSKPELFESLLSAQVLTGRPSVCLANLKSTANKVGVGDDFIRHKFLQSLPPSIAPVLAAQSTLTLTQLGNLADELIALTPINPPCSNIVGVAQSSGYTRHNSSFRSGSGGGSGSNIGSNNNNSSGGSGNNQVHPSVRPFFANQRARVCRAHIYYGNQARTCRQWCCWPTKSTCKVEANSRPTSPAHRQRDLNENGAQ